MSATFNCRCAERHKPIAERNWRVLQYRCNHSAFNGYHYTPSNWSTVACYGPGCTGCGRTKAKFVEQLMALGKEGYPTDEQGRI